MESLTRAWLPRIYGYAVSLTRDREEAEDLTQEAFLRAFRAPDALRDPAAFGPWLLRVVKNAWIDRLRRSGRERALAQPELVEAPEAGDDPEGPAGWKRLPEDERIVCWLKLVAGMTFRDVADLLVTSKSAVARTWARALERLRGVHR